jgi:hypothetical protein
MHAITSITDKETTKMADMTAYREAANQYMSAMGAMTEGDTQPAFRSGSAEPPDPEAMKKKAEDVATASSACYAAGMTILQEGDAAERAWMTGQFLAQAAADFEVATELLKAMAEGDEPSEPADEEVQALRSGGEAAQTAMENLKATMSMPMDASFKPQAEVSFRGGGAAMSGPEARIALRDSAKQAITTIVDGTSTQGQKLFTGLLAEKGTDLLSSANSGRDYVAGKIGELNADAGERVTGSIDTISQLVLTAYDRLLAIVGRDAEDQARATVKGWLEEAEGEEAASLFAKQLLALYGAEKAHTAIGEWVNVTEVDDTTLNEVRDAIEEIAARYDALVLKQAETFDKVLDRAPAVVALFKTVALAPLTAVIFAMRFGLLTTLVYAGYDYIGYEQGKFLDITEGVVQVIEGNLEVTPEEDGGGPTPENEAG